jgi:hypothetical protein
VASVHFHVKGRLWRADVAREEAQSINNCNYVLLLLSYLIPDKISLWFVNFLQLVGIYFHPIGLEGLLRIYCQCKILTKLYAVTRKEAQITV